MIDRKRKALLALYDHGTRTGATAKSVMKAMEKDGFTPDEIKEAVEAMRGEEA